MSLNQLENVIKLDGWIMQKITPQGNHYKIFLDPSKYPNNALTMTGSNLTKELFIPYTHRINKITLTHKDNTLVDNSDAFTFYFGLTDNQTPNRDDFLLYINAETSFSYIDKFGEGYEYEAAKWALVANTTATHKLIPIIYIQVLGQGGL